MMGVIELILIAVVIGIISSVMISSSLTHSRVDWSKVFLVFLAFPFLLIVALGGAYFSMRTHAQHEVGIAREKEQAAIREVELEAARAGAAANHLSEVEISINDAGETPSPAASKSMSSSSHAVISEHQMPSHLGRATEMISHPTVLIIALKVLIIAAVLGGIIWFLAKKKQLATVLGCLLLAGMLLIGGLYSSRSASNDRTTSHTMDSIRPPRPVQVADLEDDVAGSIPVGEEVNQAEAMKPLSILEFDYDKGYRTSTTSKTESGIPNWVEEAMNENIVRLDQNEIVITSKRYSSLDEAEAELYKTAEVLVTDYIVGIYPEMREHWVDANQIKQLGILEKSCEITWPFHVGEFKDQVFQVSWQLDVTQRIQRQLHTQWQNQKLTHRLAVIGGAFTLLTLIFGIGAIATRARDEEPSSV